MITYVTYRESASHRRVTGMAYSDKYSYEPHCVNGPALVYVAIRQIWHKTLKDNWYEADYGQQHTELGT